MRVLSGIQPTGTIHLGNYFGAIRNWVELQEKYECVFMLADLHALTIPQDPEQFRQNTAQMLIDLLAVGINPEKCILFVQSQVKEHAELAWLLSTLTPLGELERMTQYKDKSRRLGEETNAGLFTYPILQAADILLYQTDLVPVGKDQEQHLEFARTIARKFNRRFGETFKEPKALVPKQGAKIMSLADPTKKMSKSLGPKHYLSLFDEQKVIREKIKTAVTDPGKEIKFSETKPGISNLLTILSLTSNRSIKELEKEFADSGYAEFKNAVAEELIRFTAPFQLRQRKMQNNENYIYEIAAKGAERAKVIAAQTLSAARRAIGLV